MLWCSNTKYLTIFILTPYSLRLKKLVQLHLTFSSHASFSLTPPQTHYRSLKLASHFSSIQINSHSLFSTHKHTHARTHTQTLAFSLSLSLFLTHTHSQWCPPPSQLSLYRLLFLFPIHTPIILHQPHTLCLLELKFISPLLNQVQNPSFSSTQLQFHLSFCPIITIAK